MGLFGWLSRLFLILIILNLVDTIICIIWPALTHTLHYYPSLTDTLYILVTGPTFFSTKLNFSFKICRIIILLLVLSTLIAITSTKKLGTIRSYEITIFVLSIITLSIIGYNELKYSASSIESLASSIFNYVFVENLKLIFVALIYHIPFAIMSFMIYIGMHRYKEFLLELKITRVPKESKKV